MISLIAIPSLGKLPTVELIKCLAMTIAIDVIVTLALVNAA